MLHSVPLICYILFIRLLGIKIVNVPIDGLGLMKNE